MAQWHELVIHLGTDTVAAEEGVDGEGEIEGCTVGRQCTDFSLRGKYEYLTGKEVQFDGVEEVHGVGLWVVEDLLDGAKPLVQFGFVLRIFFFYAVFVFPMGSKSLLRNLVHAV